MNQSTTTTNAVTGSLKEIRQAARQGAQTLTTLPADGDALAAWLSAGSACVYGALDFTRDAERGGKVRHDKVAPDHVLEGLAAAEQWFGQYLEQSRSLPEKAVLRSVRVLAAAVLLRGLEASDAGVAVRNVSAPIPDLARQLRAAERRSREAWRACRALTRRARASELAVWYADLQDHLDQLWPLVSAAASTHVELQRERVPSVRAAELVRDAALLVSAAPLLAHRLSDERLVHTTDDIARRREQLMRRDGPAASGLSRVPPNATTASLYGVIEETEWRELPEKPYAIARTSAGILLALPHKRFATRGVVPNMAFWAAGSVEQDFLDGEPALVIEAEGPGQHATSVFLDWIADEVRPAYDRFPGSLRLAAELPNTRHGGLREGLRAHLPSNKRPRARNEKKEA